MRSPAACALLPLVIAGCMSAGRQPLPPPGTPPPVAPQLEQDPLAGYPELLLLSGHATDLRYTPDALDRAAQVQRRLEEMAEVFQLIAGDPVRLEALVLDRAAWARLLPDRAWGLPALTLPKVFAVAAEGDQDSVRQVRALTGGWLPPLAGTPFRGTADEAAALAAADTLLQLGVCRAFLDDRQLRGEEPWLSALLAHILARIAWERTDAGQMHLVADQFDRMAEVSGRGRPLSLSDYRPGLPLAEDLAWQAAFLRGADLAWVEMGEGRALRYLRYLMRQHAVVTREDLEKEVPALVAWANASFVPEIPPNP
jgi:hypothetical protein